jgi:hypothetical protein
VSDDVKEVLMENAGLGDFYSEQSGDLFEGDQHGGAGREPEQHGVRDKVEQRPYPGHTHTDLDNADQRCQKKCQHQICGGIRPGQRNECTEDDQGHGGRGSGDQVRGTAPKTADDGGDD